MNTGLGESPQIALGALSVLYRDLVDRPLNGSTLQDVQTSKDPINENKNWISDLSVEEAGKRKAQPEIINRFN